MAIPQSTNDGQVSTELTADAIEDALNNDEQLVIPENDEVVIPDNEDSEDETNEEETPVIVGKKKNEEIDENEEPTIEQDEDELIYQDIPRRQIILKEFPNLFKKFPSIETAIFREKRYSEIFPSIGDAKEAKESIAKYQELENKVLDGSLDEILNTVKTQNPKAFNKIRGNYLQILGKVDPSAQLDVVNHVIVNTLQAALQYANQNQSTDEGKQLAIAARLVNKFIYGTPNIQNQPNGQQQQLNDDSRPDPREEELNKREQEFVTKRFNEALSSVSTEAESKVKSAVDKYIDPRGQMSEYVKTRAVKDAMDLIQKEFNRDGRFKTSLEELWKQAHKDDYSEASRAKIRKHLIFKAQSVLTDVIKKVRNEALKGGATQTQREARTSDELSTPRARTNNGKTEQPNKNAPVRVNSVDDVMKFLE